MHKERKQGELADDVASVHWWKATKCHMRSAEISTLCPGYPNEANLSRIHAAVMAEFEPAAGQVGM